MPGSAATQILQALGPSCRDTGRREAILAQDVVNGIDFVEFEVAAGGFVLHVHFLDDLPAGAWGLPVSPGKVRIHGGTRITGIEVTDITPGASPKVLDVEVDRQGDFAPYLLAIGWDEDGEGRWRYAFTGLDRLFSVAPLTFRPDCPVDFDCDPDDECPEEPLAEPMLDYLAKDYASFRQLLLDLVAQRHPGWIERNPSDLGIALLELFAYEGDQLSYFQDAVANEAYLDTARQRVSAKRHASLVDYRMHDGRNAWTYVHLAVDSKGTMAPGQQLLTRIVAPLRVDRTKPVATHPTVPPETQIRFVSDSDFQSDPVLAQVRVFETATDARVDPRNNEIRVHAWGNDECCLPRGTTTAHLYAITGEGAATTAVRPDIRAGDLLLLEEVRGPGTGAAADADPAHRAVVRIVTVTPDPALGPPAPDNPMQDPLRLAAIDADGEPKQVTPQTKADPKLPLLEVTWRREDALALPLCLTARRPDRSVVRNVSVARGNLVLADHGRTVLDDERKPETERFDPPLDGSPGFRLRLAQGPQTMQCPPDATGTRGDLGCDVREARPAIVLEARRGDRPAGTWLPVPGLLASREFAPHFVADIDAEGRAVLRFGDGEYGRRFAGIDTADIRYRVGNGRAGNIGADALAHIVVPYPEPAGWPAIVALRNPLPATGGVDPETIDEVRQYAPAAFRARQDRAVTERDYEDAARRIPGVEGAVAAFRWTGSWYTVFIGIDPVSPDDVVTDLRGVAQLEPRFELLVHDALTRVRLAGYDLEIRPARYMSLEIDIELCARPGYFRGDVAQAVVVALGAGQARGGTGFFNPANFTFGQPVYLSRLYAAIEQVEGVESAMVTRFQRRRLGPRGELEQGVIPIGAWEIARLDNNRSNMENGTLRITAGGGS
jgi:hypothetical protein